MNNMEMDVADILQNMLTAYQPPLAGIFHEDVPVVPTNAQIDAGSEVVNVEDIPNDAICAVCQHHEYRPSDAEEAEAEAEADANQWRRLTCDHEFHRPCIDRWFSQSVFCPVCRLDIRQTEEM